jgi:hypothetical protein
VLLCWNLASQDLAGKQIGTESACFEVSPDGTLGSKARLSVNAFGLFVAARDF